MGAQRGKAACVGLLIFTSSRGPPGRGRGLRPRCVTQKRNSRAVRLSRTVVTWLLASALASAVAFGFSLFSPKDLAARQGRSFS
jgi:hypothetical protein